MLNHLFSFFQEQYKTVLLTLDEEFRARIEPQSLSNFAENLTNLTDNFEANQSYIRQQFEVRKKMMIMPEGFYEVNI